MLSGGNRAQLLMEMLIGRIPLMLMRMLLGIQLVQLPAQESKAGWELKLLVDDPIWSFRLEGG